jgi:hypothetical protein
MIVFVLMVWVCSPQPGTFGCHWDQRVEVFRTLTACRKAAPLATCQPVVLKP